MKSKTSFFNTGIFLNNCIRFWPVWALYLGLLFFLVPVGIYSQTRDYNPGNDTDSWYLHAALESASAGYSVLLVFLVSILSAAAVFFYLYSSRSSNMTHAFPLKRSQLFITNYLSGLAFLVIPQLLTGLMAVPGFLRLEIPAKIIGFYLLHALGYDLIFYSIAVFCCMLAGHILSAIAFYFVFNGVYMVCKLQMISFQALGGYGLRTPNLGDVLDNGSADNFLSPLVFLFANSGIRITSNSEENIVTTAEQLASLKVTGSGIIAAYCLAALLLVLCTFWLYKKRRLERAGEMSAFTVLNPVMRWIIAVCGGMTFAFILTGTLFNFRGMTGSDKVKPFILCFLLFSLIWFFITEMILKKSFRIFSKKRWLEWAACGALGVLLLCAVSADAFHIVRYIPPADQVKAAAVAGNYTIIADEPAEVSRIIELQGNILDHRKEYQDQEREALKREWTDTDYINPLVYISISYYMKDGSTVYRVYPVPVTKETVREPGNAVSLLSTLETPESALLFILGMDYPEIQFTSGDFNGSTFNEEDASALYEAIRLDIEEDNLHFRTVDIADQKPTFEEPWGSLVTINLYGICSGRHQSVTEYLFTEILKDTQGQYSGMYGYGTYYNLQQATLNGAKKINGTYSTTVDVSFYINEDCTHTIEVLKELGLADGPETILEIQKKMTEKEYSELP